MSLAEAFDKHFSVKVYPEVPNGIALVDGVHDKAMQLAEELGMKPIDLRREEDALRELTYRKVCAVLGRGGMDLELERAGRDVFRQLRQSGIQTIVRLGNGVGMDAQEAFDTGIVVERTPRGNAEAVRIWQDLMLIGMIEKSSDYIDCFEGSENPVVRDNDSIKNTNSVSKLKWSRTEVPIQMTLDLLTVREHSPKYFAGKKVAVIGAGRIGTEVMHNSVFLKEANLFAYDPQVEPGKENGVTFTGSIEDALQDAELVLLHVDGKKQIIGEKEIALLKDGAMICNCARGGNIDPKALYEAIERGKISKAGLDTHVVEGKALLDYSKTPSSGELQPGHYAHLLRQHPRVIATNHSAASEVKAQEINAEDGVSAVHRYNTRGEIVDGVIVPETRFPYDAFVQESDGRLSPIDYRGPRCALELIHAGEIRGLIGRVRLKIGSKLGGELNVVSGALSQRQIGDRRFAVDFHAVDLPEEVWGQVADREWRFWEELTREAEGEAGIRRARIFVPESK